jgi:butyrate kinase
VDPISVDELADAARWTGLPEIPRISLCHALNMKAIARQAAADSGKRYEEARIIVAHLGGGGSVSAHLNGEMMDILNSDVEGPFSAERAGALPSFGLVNLCFEPGMTRDKVWGRISGKGGLVAHLGTKDAREIEARVRAGDAHAEQVYRAMAYAIAKGIASMVGALGALPDAVALTGGLAKSRMLTDWITERVRCLGPVRLYPGEFEMDALARGVLRVLEGDPVKTYG